MMMLLYFLKTILCSALLLAYYNVALKNRPFHQFNRFYLLGILLFSVVLPLLEIPIHNSAVVILGPELIKNMEVVNSTYYEEGVQTDTSASTQIFTISSTFFLIYLSGLVYSLFLIFRSFLKIGRLSRKYPSVNRCRIQLYQTAEPGTPFSFFNKIFWNRNIEIESDEGRQMFHHEMNHVSNKHSLDILFAETVTAVCWINPVFYLVKKEVRAVHEFQADEHAIADSDRFRYAELILSTLTPIKIERMNNYFFHNHIKRRIQMITNNKPSRYGSIARILSLPLLGILFISFGLKTTDVGITGGIPKNYPVSTAPTKLKVMIDAGHGGKDAGAYSEDGTVYEKDIALQIARKIKLLSNEYNIEIHMTREGDEYPGIKERPVMAKTVGADLTLSLHVAAEPLTNPDGSKKTDRKSGFEIFVSQQNKAVFDASKKLGANIAKSVKEVYTTNTSLKQSKEGIWVLNASHCPAILIECGYMTNENDLSFFRQDINQERVARKILEGLVNYAAE